MTRPIEILLVEDNPADADLTRETFRDAKIVNKLHQETEKALAVPSVQERLAKIGQDAVSMTSEDFDRYFREDVLATAKLMREVGVQQVEQ